MDWKEDEPLKPRISKEERMQYRNEGCVNCRQNAPLRPRRGINPLLVVIVLAVCAAYLLMGRPASSRTLSLKKGCTLKWTAVNDEGRQGLSMVLQNQSGEPWGVKYVIASSQTKAYTNVIDKIILPRGLETSFLPLPSEQKYKIKVEPL